VPSSIRPELFQGGTDRNRLSDCQVLPFERAFFSKWYLEGLASLFQTSWNIDSQYFYFMNSELLISFQKVFRMSDIEDQTIVGLPWERARTQLWGFERLEGKVPPNFLQHWVLYLEIGLNLKDYLRSQFDSKIGIDWELLIVWSPPIYDCIPNRLNVTLQPFCPGQIRFSRRFQSGFQAS